MLGVRKNEATTRRDHVVKCLLVRVEPRSHSHVQQRGKVQKSDHYLVHFTVVNGWPAAEISQLDLVGDDEDYHREKCNWEQDWEAWTKQECYPGSDQYLRVLVVNIELPATV